MKNLAPTHLLIATRTGTFAFEIPAFLIALLTGDEGDCLCPGCAGANIINAEFEVVEHDEEPKTTRYPRLLLEEAEPETQRIWNFEDHCILDTDPNCRCKRCEQETLAVFDLVPFSWINPSLANTNLAN